MKSIIKILLSILCFSISLPLIAMTSEVVYDNPQHSSGSFTLDPNDYNQPGWYYYFEITVPANSMIKINYSCNSYIYAEFGNEIDGCIISSDGPFSESGSFNNGSSTKFYVFIYDEGVEGSCNFHLSYVAGSYSSTQDSYLHGNSIIDGKVGIGTSWPSGKLGIVGNEPVSIYSYNYNQSPYGNYGLLSYSGNNAGPTYGIYSYVWGTGGASNQRYSGYFTGGNLVVTNGKMGVGTTNPTESLDINGNVNLNNIYYQSSSCLNPGYYVYKSGIVSYGMKLQYTEGKFGTMIFGPNQANRFIGFGKAGNALTDDQMIESMRIDLNNGNVGIGTTSPRAALEVFGNNKSPKIALRFSGASQSAVNYIQSDTEGHYMEFGTYGTGNTSKYFGLNIAGSTSLFMSPKTTGYAFFGTATESPIIIGTSNIERMRIKANGNIGIGTTNPQYTLDVNGTIRANEVLVNIVNPADYVFHPSYKLMPLPEVEQYVKANSHLPEIPSASEVQKNGLSMGEMQNKLLQKVEELTLYVIEQQKTINQQGAKIAELEKNRK